jgi:hypothetical protein
MRDPRPNPSRRIVALAAAAVLSGAGAAARAEDPGNRAWGRIQRMVAGGTRAIVKPDKGRFVEGASVAIYEQSRELCGGVVGNVYHDVAYVTLDARCAGVRIDPATQLVIMNATWHEISGEFTRWEGRRVTGEMADIAGGIPLRFKRIFARTVPGEGIRVAFSMLDSRERLAAADGELKVTISGPPGPGQPDGTELCAQVVSLKRSDFKANATGPEAGAIDLLAYRTDVIHYYNFTVPPPLKQGASGKVTLFFRMEDGRNVSGSAVFPFDD